MRTWPVSALVVLGLAVAACGDDDGPTGDSLVPVTGDTTSTTGPPTTGPPTTDPPSTEPPPTDPPATEPPATDPPPTEPPPTEPPATEPPPTDPPATDPSATTVADDTPPPAGRPIVAVDGAGDAVYLASPDATPVLLYDGPEPSDEPEEGPGPNVVDVIAISPDGTDAWVGLCCEPIAGSVLRTRLPAPASYDTSETSLGYGPSVDPTGTYVATGQIAGSPIAVTRLADGSVLAGPSIDDEEQFSPYDTIWLDDRLVAAIGILNDPDAGWVIIVHAVDGDTLVELDTIVIGPLGDEFFQFAGRLDGGRVAIHDYGAATALAVPITGPGEIDTLELPGPSQSYWFGGIEADIRVDDAGVLTVGDQVVPGEYSWARG